MFRLTDLMLQRFECNLKVFHRLFKRVRCSGEQQKELLVNAIEEVIKKDSADQRQVTWKPNNRRPEPSISVGGQGLYVRSANPKKKGSLLGVSSHRLVDYVENDHFDPKPIEKFLNSNQALTLLIAYSKSSNQHEYQLFYVEPALLRIPSNTAWVERKNKQGKVVAHECTMPRGVHASINPGQSWELWWTIPLEAIPSTARSRVMSVS